MPSSYYIMHLRYSNCMKNEQFIFVDMFIFYRNKLENYGAITQLNNVN